MGHFWGGASTPGQPVFKLELDNHDIPDSQGERCRWLMAELLHVAIVEYRQGRARYLRDWIGSESQLPRSFKWLCHVVGIDPEAAQRQLLSEKPVRQGRKMRSDRRTTRSYVGRATRTAPPKACHA
jgi:hypothetical protein